LFFPIVGLSGEPMKGLEGLDQYSLAIQNRIMEVNIHEAGLKLSQLVERAMAGEEVILAEAGQPMVKLVRVEDAGKRVLGSAAGMIQYTEGWDSPMSDDQLS
jgi:prevent-host-death family protein